jgi:hypothetical protein
VSPYLEIILVILLPTAAGYGLIGLVRLLRWAAGRWPAARAPEPEPIERLTQTLRRLRAELETVETAAGIPSKHVRLQALRGAYLDALKTACHRVGASPPQVTGPAGAERASQAEIYRVEAALRQRGVDVREPATH